MKKIRTVLTGLGNVNIGLLKVLVEKSDEIASDYRLGLSIVGVADSSGVALNKNGYGFRELIDLKANGGGAKYLEGYLQSTPTEDIVDAVDADLLVEASPVDLKTGNPGLAVIRAALCKGWSVVSANKSPLVLAFDELHSLAEIHGGSLSYSAAVCGGLPVINVLQRDLAATELISLEGVFNATTNFILEELEQGRSFDDAVFEAQQIGAAETDPSLDIDGYDSANKLYIIIKSSTDFSGSLSDIRIEGIRGISLESIREASTRNKRIKLIASAKKLADDWELSVIPTEVETDTFLGRCDGWEMGIQLKSDYYREISMKIFEKEPISTCAAVLRDIVNTYTHKT